MATFAAPAPLIPPFGCPPRRTSRNLPRIEISGCLTDESHLRSRLYKCFVCNQMTFRNCAFHLRSGKAVANDPPSQPCASAGMPATQPFLRQGEQAAPAISYPSGVAGEEKPNKSGHLHLLTTAKSLPGLMASVSSRGRDGGQGA